MDTEEIKALLRGIIEKLGRDVSDIEVSELAGHTLYTILSKDSGPLIGSGGEALHSLNHIAKKIVEKRTPEGIDAPRFIVDVNGYHAKYVKKLESEARMMAERARTFKYDVDLSPMSAYDRLIVHAALQGLPEIRTESEGEGKLRHIIIRYTGAQATAADPTIDPA